MFLFIIIALLFILYLKPHQRYHIFQSEKRLRNIEVHNFSGPKTKTQWWYFDCLSEDGSVLAFMFTPYQWWSEEKWDNGEKSLFYISYRNNEGHVLKDKAVFDSSKVKFTENSIKSPFFELYKMHGKKNRNYNIEVFLKKIKASIKIHSDLKPFSPFPTGRFDRFVSKYLIGFKGTAPDFQYASYVPSGKMEWSLDVEGQKVQNTGLAYHEQGRFNGLANEMGQGWIWIHFVSERLNIFGKPGIFLFVQMDGKVLFDGITILRKCQLSNEKYSEDQKDTLINGSLHYYSKSMLFEIVPLGLPSQVLLSVRSYNGRKTWASVVQPSKINFRYKDKEFSEEGNLILETCKTG
ncbi:MAG: hypothetical protein ACK4ND_16605 [Cytophagaceae bacterium]